MACCCAIMLLGSAGIASAQDAVKLSGLWIEPVTVRGIEHGTIRYQTRQGIELSRPAEQLEGLRLERYPQLAEAQDATEQGDDVTAAKKLAQVEKKAREDWVRYYAQQQRVAALARSGEVAEAVDVYVDLLMSDAGLSFVSEPPTDALAQADIAVRRAVQPLLNAAGATLDDDRKALLKPLIDAVGHPLPEADVTSPDTQPETHKKPDTNPGLAPKLSAAVPPGTAADLYSAGRFERALTVNNEALNQPGRTAAKLYLKGMCQYAIADQTHDPTGYKTAGLSFMRVVTYFPQSAVAGPAYVEAAFVHLKIGRPDLAQKLYNQAAPLIVENEDTPAYQRLQALAEALKQTDPNDPTSTEEHP